MHLNGRDQTALIGGLSGDPRGQNVWAQAYVGLPYEDRGLSASGVDCWGLARLVIGECLGLWLPAYDDRPHKETGRAQAARIDAVLADSAAAFFDDVPLGAPRRSFDLLRVSLKGRERHIGVCVGGGDMLHVMRNTHAVIERVQQTRWRLGRIVSVHRLRTP